MLRLILFIRWLGRDWKHNYYYVLLLARDEFGQHMLSYIQVLGWQCSVLDASC